MGPREGREQAAYAVLDELRIAYERHEHPPVFTVEQAAAFDRSIDAAHCKNLFLRNKRGDREYLLIAEHRKAVDLRRLSAELGAGRLGLASPERLRATLGLTPGAVSPFGLMNSRPGAVTVLIDAGLRQSRRIAFHPNINTATVVIAFADFERFLEWTGHDVVYLEGI